jgi:hypothetical protein
MDCVCCGSSAVTERPERTARGYRRFRCLECGKQFNERSGGLLNRTQYPSDLIALVVLWRLRYRLTQRDLVEMFLIRGIVFSHEAVRDWEAKLAPVLTDALRQRRHGKRGSHGRHWNVDETYLKVHGPWAPFSAFVLTTTSMSPPAVAVCFTSVVPLPCSPFSERHRPSSAFILRGWVWREC